MSQVVGPEMMRNVRRYVCAIFLLILISPFSYALSKKEAAKALYDKAVRMESDLKASSKAKSNLANWKKVIATYQTVYYKYPTSGYCDNSLFQVASLYSLMAEQFKDNFYYRRSVATYQFLIEQY